MRPVRRRGGATSALAVGIALSLLPVLTAVGPVPPAAAALTIGAHKIVGGLPFPAAFTFSPSGKILYGQRFTGQIHVYNPATASDRRLFTIPKVVNDPSGEQGLLGLAFEPNYPASPYVYAYATRNVNGQERDQIVRITVQGGSGTSMRVIFNASTTSGSYHDGGRILFGPDGKLYAVMGEAHKSSNAQDLTNPAGKVLRMNPNGAAPADNPGFADPLIWSYGLRNSFGFAFDPQTGNLWETENGPACNDEINRIVKGGNFGWGPSQTCGGTSPLDTNQDGPSPILPLQWYTPTIAPTGAAFCQACGLGAASDGTLFFGAYNDGRIRRLTLTPSRLDVASQQVVYQHPTGILSMEVGPLRRLYFSDSSGIWRLNAH